MAYYVDTSALVKLVIAEDGSRSLRRWWRAAPREPVSSDLARAELVRAMRRVAPDRVVEARALLDSITLLSVTSATFDAAGHLDPRQLRTLDALHLAAALGLGDDLAGMVTYDDRLAAAARAHGVEVVAPE